MASSCEKTNRLIHETSPYLLQHAHNPVDWYPWGIEAFEAARSQNKPIFLSVGYSTCYWCHVMERESFENELVAREMNQRFINIKVDREERPDVDQLYMTAVQVLTRHGGWPMSVFLMPDLRPFYGGTYFPPTDGHGRPGFVTVMRAIDDAYHNRRPDVEQSAAQLRHILEQLAEPEPPDHPIRIDEKFIKTMIERSTSDFDPVNGGFGGAPKFPRETLLELLLSLPLPPGEGRGEGARENQRPSASQSPLTLTLSQREREQLRKTLDAMANGGIRDHLGGGFHRYSTDARWRVPHFEIMLYDNAMLAWIYAEASRKLNEPRYASIARDICDSVLREMTSPDGAFFTALDAEVDAREGGSYLWTEEQVESLLQPEEAALFNRVYGLGRGPNFADPHHGSGVADQNVLYLPDGPPSESDEARLVQIRSKLYEARKKRKQPLLDTKIITSWNALMIPALAHAGRVLNEPRYVEAANKSADFLLKHHRRDDGELFRTSRDGHAKYDAFLDDYAFLSQALLVLHRRDEAEVLVDALIEKFNGRYFTAAGADDLIVRQMVGSDSPLPAGAAVAASVLIELGRFDEARGIIESFASHLEQNAESMSAMLQAAEQYVRARGPIDVAAGKGSINRPPSPQQVAADVVSLSATWADATTLHISAKIGDGFHINTNRPHENLVATTLEVVSNPDAQVDYPTGTERRFSFTDQPIQVYEGAVTLVVRFQQPASQALRLALTYQACDDSACLPMITKQFEIAIAR